MRCRVKKVSDIQIRSKLWVEKSALKRVSLMKLWVETVEIPVKMEKLRAKIMVIFCDFLMFDQIFVSSQVKRCMIITNKHGI